MFSSTSEKPRRSPVGGTGNSLKKALRRADGRSFRVVVWSEALAATKRVSWAERKMRGKKGMQEF